MSPDSWNQTIDMNDRRKEIEGYAKALADHQVTKDLYRTRIRAAVNDPALIEIVRVKAWLAADSDAVTAYKDPTSRDGVRFEMPAGWPVGTDPREAEYRIRELLYPDEADRQAHAWVFEGDE